MRLGGSAHCRHKPGPRRSGILYPKTCTRLCPDVPIISISLGAKMLYENDVTFQRNHIKLSTLEHWPGVCWPTSATTAVGIAFATR